MTLRRRVTVLVAAIAAGAFVVAGGLFYLTVQRSLLDEVDTRLEATRDRAVRSLADPRGRRPPPGGVGRFFEDLFRGGGITQVVDADGSQRALFPDGAELPVDDTVVAVARDGATHGPAMLRFGDGTYRALTFSPVTGIAIRLARPIDEIDGALRRLRLQLVLGSLVAVGLAAAAGRVVAARILRPVAALTDTAEVIAATEDLAHRIGLAGNDELARLGAAFDDMLAALERSRRAQQQLVADASHELRTPLTSLRTNVELLADAERLDAGDRAALRADVLGQVAELTTLVGNLVELARDGAGASAMTVVALEELVDEAVARQRRLTPGVEIRTDLEPASVVGDPDRLRLAVANLLDNAIKYGDGPIDVTVATDGGVASVIVRDHGPGIDAAHARHVFDRFWRAPADRGSPGSGLGLAIVSQVAQAHGGTAEVEHPDGGAAIRLTLPLDAPLS